MTSPREQPLEPHGDMSALRGADLVAALRWCSRWARRQKMKQVISQAAKVIEGKSK